MPPQEFAFAAPGTEEMTMTGVGVVGAAVAGVVEGVIVKMAPQLGALETPFTWATLLGIPAVGIAGALTMKGMIGDLFKGVAFAGTGIAAYVLPAMLIPEGLFGRRGQGQLGAGQGLKQLGMGSALDAPARAQQAAARSGIEF